jgi:DNA-binding transcriptional ArsR family regulator
METLLPTQTTEAPTPSEKRIPFGEADELFDALSSRTAREVLETLYEEPATKSQVANRVDSSIQNVSYHLKNLERADLVTPVDTWYSRKGQEMDVYAPTAGPLILDS